MSAGSKRNHASSTPSKAKMKRKIAWEDKKNLVRKRLMILEQQLRESDKKDASMTPDPPTVKTSGVEFSAMDRAKEVQAKLSPDFPTFLKLMLKSHVSGGFWLSFPCKYCRDHLPKHDVTVALVDENGEEYNAKYLLEKNGLSGGWRGFSTAHKLLDGDVLVFQLIAQLKFKIYIVRATSSTKVDAAKSLQNLDSLNEPITKATVKLEEMSEDDGKISEVESQNTHRRKGTKDGARFLESNPSFEDFTIHVDGLILESELSVHLRKKYYELCCTQNNVLHDNLIKGLNTKLVVGMISETISIADAVRAIKSTTATDQLESWDRTLKAFEDLGMGVGFILTRIDILLSLSRESQAIIESKETERARVEGEMRDLRMKLTSAEVAINCLDAEIKALKAENEKHEFVFKEVASAPW